MVTESVSECRQLNDTQQPTLLSASSPRYGMTTLTCLVIASMIGAGVFTTSGYSLQSLGSPLRVMIAWCIGGLIALCGAVAYGALARQIPESGGEYLYLSRRIHPFAGFIAGWVSLTAGFSGAIAAAAVTSEKYLLPADARPDWLPERAFALLIVVACGLGHSFVVRLSAVLQNTVVLLKLVAILAFLGCAAASIPAHPWQWEPDSGAVSDPSALVLAMATSVMWISYSFAGFNAAVYVASEVPDTQRIVPRALLLGTCLTTLLYLLLNLTFVSAAPFRQLAGQADIAAVAAGAIGARPLELLIRTIIGLATFSSVAGMIMAGPRVYARMADDGVFPGYFRSGARSVPRTVLLQSLLAILLICGFQTLTGLLSYLGTTLSLSSAVTVAALFRGTRRISTPGAGRDSAAAVAIPLPLRHAVAALIYIVATLCFIVLMTIHEPRQLWGTLATIVAGALLWRASARASRNRCLGSD